MEMLSIPWVPRVHKYLEKEEIRNHFGGGSLVTVAAQKEAKPVSLKRAFVWAGVLVGIDAFILNQGAISALVGLWMLFVSLPRAVFTKIPKQRNRRFARIAIFLGAVILVFGLNWANNQIARKRADTLVIAIKAFDQ